VAQVAKYWNQPLSEIEQLSIYGFMLLEEKALKETEKDLKRG